MSAQQNLPNVEQALSKIADSLPFSREQTDCEIHVDDVLIVNCEDQHFFYKTEEYLSDREAENFGGGFHLPVVSKLVEKIEQGKHAYIDP